MSGEAHPDLDFKSCCSAFYADEIVRRIIGDSFHPGGEELTSRLLEKAHVEPGDSLLDMAAGQGTSSVLAAKERGCRVTALDLSEQNLRRAAKAAEEDGVGHLVSTTESDAEELPFEDGSFDKVLCECAFCVFPDKARAASQMFRVLKPGGTLILSDMTLREGPLPGDLSSLLMRVACIADATTVEALSRYLSDAGFISLTVDDASWGLSKMVKEISGRLLAAEIASKMGKLKLGGIDIDSGKELARTAARAIEDGSISYTTIIARKGTAS